MPTIFVLLYLLVAALVGLMFAVIDRRAQRHDAPEIANPVPQWVVWSVLGLAWPMTAAFLLLAVLRNRTRRRGAV